MALLFSSTCFANWRDLEWLELMEPPDSMLDIYKIDELDKYLNSQSEFDQYNACCRLGRIGGLKAFNRLKIFFEQSINQDNQCIRYYILSSIGKTKRPDAITYLRKIFDSYAYHYRWATGKMTADTAAVAFGALIGLRNALEPVAYQSLLGTIFVGPKYNCEIKVYAYKSILETGFEKGHLSGEQISDYLKWQLTKQGHLTGMLNENGTVNAAYVERTALEEMLDIYLSYKLGEDKLH